MRKSRARLTLVALCVSWALSLEANESGSAGAFNWLGGIPDLPPSSGEVKQVGLAGTFAGTHNKALIVAGGANFPDLPPWEGGKKVWWDDVFILEKTSMPGEPEEFQWFTSPKLELIKPSAYGVSISTKDGLLCIGGCDSDRFHDDVFRIQWLPVERELKIQRLPNLPRPLAFMSGAMVGEVVYIVGGQEKKGGEATNNFWALDLSSPKESLAWEELPQSPGSPRILPLTACQSDGKIDCLYLFSGRNPQRNKKTELLTDSYKFNPELKTWTRLAEITAGDGQPRSVMAGTCAPIGVSHILVFGGATGNKFLEIEEVNNRISILEKSVYENNETNSTELDTLKSEHHRFHEEHNGFSKDVLAYHVITDSWTKVGEGETPFPVTTHALPWLNGIVIPTGETSPGMRTPKIIRGESTRSGNFGTLDYLAIAIYLGFLVFIGIRLAGKEKTPDDFFKAGGRIPWWAAGLSIFGTQLSAITFMALPAKAYATDWTYLFGNLPILLVAPLIVFCFLPFYRKLDVTTAYEYLEKRFDASVRMVASSFFILLQLARIGIVLLLPSLALSVVTGMDVNTCILVMGMLCIIYVTLGGIEAVIWTDVLQVVVLLGGAVLVVASIAQETIGGFQGLLDQAQEAKKLHCINLAWDFSEPTLWTLLLGGLAASCISYGSDQTVVQRYLTTKDEKASAKSIWTNAILTVPATLLFFLVGTALYVFFTNNPETLNPHLPTVDAILPFYIVTELPEGIAGLVIAGVFAAAMSSLDSSMNSVAAAVTTDFHERYRPHANPSEKLHVARLATVAVGIAGTSLALFLAGTEIKSLWDQFVDFLGLFGGGLGGLFLLAIFVEKAHAKGTLIGLLASAIVVFSLKTWQPVHSWFYAFAGVASCFLAGIIASYLIPNRETPSTESLTWKTRSKD